MEKSVLLLYGVGIAIFYLIGSIPFGYVAGKLIKGVDIREYGSGNVGATNASRVMGWPVGVAVFALDMCKGLVAAYVGTKGLFLSGLLLDGDLSSWHSSFLGIMCGFAAICGHTWSIYFRLRGGKGVATATGVVIGLAAKAAILPLVIWVVTVKLFKYVSLGSILAAISLPVSIVVIHGGSSFRVDENLPLLLFSILLAVLVIIRHHSNIRRLAAGTESKVGEKPSQVAK